MPRSKYLDLTNNPAADRIRNAIDRELGMPLRGVHRPGGRHVDLDATGPNGAGWTTTECKVDDGVVIMTERAFALNGRVVPGTPPVRLDFDDATDEPPGRINRPDPPVVGGPPGRP